MAGKCSAVGYITTNSAGFGSQGTTYTSGGGIKVYDANNKQVGDYEVCDKCKPVCSDFISIKSSLPDTFEWGASCGPNAFKECHGAYSSQTHIDGDKPQVGPDFYGLGISTSAQCKVEFDC